MLSLLGVGQTFAQHLNLGPHFGLKAGLNFSQLFADQANIENEGVRTGLHFGIFGKIPVSDYVSFRPELLYTSVGSRLTYGESQIENLFGIEPGEVRYNLDYIQLPVAFTYNFNLFNVYAGPYLSYLVSANITNLNVTDLTTNQLVDFNENDFNRWDYGLVVGMGVDFHNFTVGMRYNYGLREIDHTPLAGALTNNTRNGVGQIYVGFGF